MGQRCKPSLGKAGHRLVTPLPPLPGAATSARTLPVTQSLGGKDRGGDPWQPSLAGGVSQEAFFSPQRVRQLRDRNAPSVPAACGVVCLTAFREFLALQPDFQALRAQAGLGPFWESCFTTSFNP